VAHQLRMPYSQAPMARASATRTSTSACGATAARNCSVLAGYERQPAPEARAAILHALRRARRQVRLAA